MLDIYHRHFVAGDINFCRRPVNQNTPSGRVPAMGVTDLCDSFSDWSTVGLKVGKTSPITVADDFMTTTKMSPLGG